MDATNNGTGETTADSTPSSPSMLPQGLKAGIKTTEFWVTAVVMLAGLLLIAKGKDELATVLFSISGIAYPGSRALVKKAASAAAPALLFLALVMGVGCSTKGYVKADALQGTFKEIRARHDAYVIADPDYFNPASPKFGQRASDLRETRLMDETIDEAISPEPSPSPSPIPGARTAFVLPPTETK